MSVYTGNNKILEKVTQAVCLVIDQRADIALNLIESYNNVGIKVIPFLAGNGRVFKKYNYIDTNEISPYALYNDRDINTRIRAYNCWKCHRLIFLNFVQQYKNDDYLLLIEDDAILTSDFTDILDNIEGYFQYNTFDMLYFGSHFSSDSFKKTYHPNLLRLYNGGGFHSVMISYKIVKELLSFEPTCPYDNIAAKYIQQKDICYTIFPACVTQDKYESLLETGYYSRHNMGQNRWFPMEDFTKEK